MVWISGDYNMVIYMPGSLKDNVMTTTYFFNGEGLEHLELVLQNSQIKLYRVHFD